MLVLAVATSVYCASIFLALLNYGAVDLLTVTILAFPIFGLLSCLLVFNEMPKHAVTTVYISAFILVFSLCWIGFQTTPLPGAIFAHPAWQEVQGFAKSVKPVISLTPADDRAGWLRIAVPFGVFIVGLLLFSTDERAERALIVMSLSGGIVALLSLLQFLFTPNMLLFGQKTAYRDSVTGFFVNRNTAATYFGLLVLLGIAMVGRAARGMNMGEVLAKLDAGGGVRPDLKRQLGRMTLHAAVFLVCIIALVLTKSRAGVGSTVVAAICLVTLMAFRPNGRNLPSSAANRRRGSRILVSIAAIAVVMFVFLFVAGSVIMRVEVQGLEDGRFCVMPGILSAVRDHLPFGAGLSSFIEVFPAYREPSCGIFGIWDMAHNVYAEGLLTLGIAFVILVALAIVWLSRVFVVGLRKRRSLRFAAELGLASMVLVAIHSAFDFSLQVSGFAICYAALLAPIVTISLRPPGSSSRVKSRSSRPSEILSVPLQ